jgi:hypothetical protein
MDYTATHSALPGKTEPTENNKKEWKHPKISLLSSDGPGGAKIMTRGEITHPDYGPS